MLLSHDEILYHEYGIELFLKTALEGIRTRFVLRHGSRDGNVGWLHLPRLKYFNLRMDCHDTHDPQWMNPSDLGDLLAFLLAQACQHFFFKSPVKYLNLLQAGSAQYLTLCQDYEL